MRTKVLWSRPVALKHLARLCALGLTLASCTGSNPSDGPARNGEDDTRPNVLIVLTDDQRKDGTMDVLERTQKWFSNGGTNFTHAYATTPLCCPFRASLMTGQYAHNHGVKLNQLGPTIKQKTTLQRYFQEAGYNTAITGKYLNSWPIDKDPPYFDRWAFFTPEVGNRGYYDVVFNTDGRRRTIAEYSTTYIGDNAVRFMEEFEKEDDTPWLILVAPFAPHGPFQAEKKYAGAPVPPWSSNPAIREQNRDDKPRFVRNAKPRRRIAKIRRVKQLRTLMSVDDLVARVTNKLEELDETDDTLAIFGSDNGYVWGEHGAIGKKLAYTQSIEVPLIVRWPAGTQRPAEDPRIVAGIDIAPTLFELAGITPTHTLDGVSLLSSERRSQILTEHWKDAVPTWASLVTNDYQYVEYYSQDEKTINFREYYDLRADPWQLENLLGDSDPANNPRVRRLHRQLAAARACKGAACP